MTAPLKVIVAWVFLWVTSLSACAPSMNGAGGGGFGRNSAEARIIYLLSEGEFSEAEALIEESVSSGLLEAPVAADLRRQIAELSLKLGEIPARLQRVANFPAKLKEYSRLEIQKMYDANDFSLASKKELQTALKLLKDVAKDNSRLLQKI